LSVRPRIYICIIRYRTRHTTTTTITIIMLYYNGRDLPIVWIGRNNNITLYIGLQSGRRLLRRRRRRQVLRLLHTRTLHYKTAINVILYRWYRYPERYHLLQKRRGQRRVVMCAMPSRRPLASFSGENVLRRETVLRLLSSSSWACGCGE